MTNSGRLIGTVVLVALAGWSASGQMPGVPQMPTPAPIPAAPPISSPQIPSPDIPSPPMSSSQTQQSTQNDQSSWSRGGNSSGSGFLGAWCAQGDPTKQTSISGNGAFLNLTNETGDTSIGNLQGPNQIQAPGWQFVTGTLSQNGRQINWSNGTFWARCPAPGRGGGGRQSSNLNGNWYPNGIRSLQCSIQQHRGNLTLQNESGQRATGSLQGRRSISTNWQGTQIAGTVSPDGNRIDWSNGTYWIRYRLY